MHKRITWWLTGSWVVLACLVLIGCATSSTSISQVPIRQTPEQLLSAAGFKQVFPATPAQKAQLDTMPQKQIFTISKGPRVYYVYADAQGGTLYVGKQQNYENFKNLLSQAQIASEQYAVAQMNNWDWYGWGPGWWGEGETGEPF